ncbi:hypothetical protein Tco_0671238 [Tanacetum coccineum]
MVLVEVPIDDESRGRDDKRQDPKREIHLVVLYAVRICEFGVRNTWQIDRHKLRVGKREIPDLREMLLIEQDHKVAGRVWRRDLHHLSKHEDLKAMWRSASGLLLVEVKTFSLRFTWEKSSNASNIETIKVKDLNDEHVAMEVKSPLVDQTNANPNVDLLKEDVGNVSVWVKLHSVHVTVFSEDGLSAIALKLGTLLMLDSYTYDMCLQSWGRSSYTRVMVNLWAGVELKDTIMEECPKNIGLGVAKNLKKPSQTSQGVLVGPKVGFKPHKEYRPVLKKPTAISSDNKKKGVEPTNEFSNSNPFNVLNLVDNDVELGINGRTTNLVNNGANSSGSSFMNVKNSSTCTTPIIDKIGKFEDLLISGQAILVDEAGNPLKKVEYPGDYDSKDDVASVDNDMARSMVSERVGFGTQSLLKQWRDSYGNGDYDEDPYDDDVYEGQTLPPEIQASCNYLDIRVRCRKKK